jgi:hypothetical protein
MMAALTALQIIPAILLALLGIPLLPVIGHSRYEASLLAALIGLAILFLLLTRSAKGPYRIAGFAEAAWLFALAWCGVHLLGGPSFRLNMTLALAVAALIGTQAHPVHSVYIILLTIAAAVAEVTNRLYGWLPHSVPAEVQNIPEFVFSIFFPVVMVVLFQAALLGFKRGAAQSPQAPRQPAAAAAAAAALAVDKPVPKGSGTK